MEPLKRRNITAVPYHFGEVNKENNAGESVKLEEKN